MSTMNMDKNMMRGILGYLPDAHANAAYKMEIKEPLVLRLEQGKDDVRMKIDAGDVLAVLMGASSKGETAVQVLVKTTAKVDVISKGSTTALGLTPIQDSMGKSVNPDFVIFVRPENAGGLAGWSSFLR